MNTQFKPLSGRIVIYLVLLLCFFGSVSTATAAPGDLFVRSGATGTDCSQLYPCSPEQAMVNAVTGDTIYFQYGLYDDTVNYPFLTINKQISLVGGWNGASVGDVVVDPDNYETVFDGKHTRALFVVNDTSGTGGLITITGFTFRAAEAITYGGAIYVQNGRVDIIDNRFLDNYAGSYGGAIAVTTEFDVQILDNYFETNSVDFWGGSIYINNGSAHSLIEGNTFLGGNAEYGTAIHNWDCSMTINRNTFSQDIGNSTIMISALTRPSTVSNNFFIQPAQDNITVSDGAENQIINNTIVGGRYGINVYAGTPTYIANNIITGTTESIHFSDNSPYGSNNLFYYNVSNPNLLANWIIDDPDFVDSATDNYHINEDSPAVNAGTPVSLNEDYDGDFRPSGGGYDIGADEIEGGFLVYLPYLTQ
jgi:predicted outer membrane repeat protein